MGTYHGIDYSHGQANYDKATGIHFGVIPMNSLSEYAYESFESDYGEPSCPKCGNPASDMDDIPEDDDTDWDGAGSDYYCEGCEYIFDSDEAYGEEPIGHNLDDDEYKGFLDSHGDVMLLSSPYYTHAQYCSPCAPGACHLSNPVDPTGPKAYCFNHDWFDKKKAPYPVYRVSDGSIVKPEPKG